MTVNIAIKQAQTWVWLAFFAAILLAWWWLYSLAHAMVGTDGSLGMVMHMGLGQLVLMWALMVAAMMAPTFVPVLKTYADLTHTGAATAGGMAALVAGYSVVWLGFSLVASLAQVWLMRAGMVAADGSSLSWAMNAVLLGMAGIYQFSKLKSACLSQCHAPMTYFTARFMPGKIGAARMGLQLGINCLGCCWALMALAFVGGTMNLAWMGLATAVMVTEKLPQIGRHVSGPIGMALLVVAFWTLGQGLLGL